MSRWFKSLRRAESGQSVIILAIGFIALVGFVGITTDVSLMFVRYNQLSRAVDSAAISAANQMRQDRNLANVRLAATQFIEFHGIDPTEVEVQTCLSLPVDQRATDELCSEDQAKLVRVTARTISPTVFMRLLGIQSFPLEASSVSQTASIDVVMVLDVSESMLRETTYEDWARVGLGVIYRPPRLQEILQAKSLPNDQAATASFWKFNVNANTPALLTVPQEVVNRRLYYVSTGGSPAPGQATPTGTPSVPDTNYRVVYNDTFFVSEYGPQAHPRDLCRVRFFPTSVNYAVDGFFYGDRDASGNLRSLLRLYQDTGLTTWLQTYNATNWNFFGFVPTYNFYGCCNDPNGDGNFSDLVCQPFRQVRDATAAFLERIDFVRGDRVALVTFDRTAYILNPYGTFIDSNGDPQRFGPMIDNGLIAETTLESLIGVRTEPSFYVPEAGSYDPATESALTFRWSGYAAGLDEAGQSIPVDFAKTVYDAGDAGNPEAYIYPVYSSCPFHNAFQPPSRSMFPDGLNNATLPSAAEDSRWEFPFNNARYHDSSGGANNPYRLSDSSSQRVVNLLMSYELWASCRNGNVGAALREANNALLNPRTVRRFGTIWIIVLLSDGGAGASDPVRRNAQKLIAGNPYFRVGVAPNITYGRPGQYGAYGLCPYGTPSNPGELVRGADDPGLAYVFPYCSDEDPMTRQFCDFRPLLTLPQFGNNRTAMQDDDYVPYIAPDNNSHPRFDTYVDGSGTLVYALKSGQTLPSNQTSNPFAGPQDLNDEEPWNRQNDNLYDIDLAGLDRYGRPCDPLYDVDDYSRDWADYIGLKGLYEGDVLLPTIFTIGFGLEYTNRNDGGTILDITQQGNTQRICELNPGDCIGEQLLRYIADVGDNNVIDNDYYQDLYDDGAINFLSNPIDFGPRDPCQTPFTPPPGANLYDTNGDFTLSAAEIRVMYGMLRPQLSCGNYYFAPDGNELQFVFDDIASRMFTRLAR